MNTASPRDLYILGMVSRGPTYGHEIIKAIKVSRADQWVSLSDKHVYYVLRKLARDGMVIESEERDSNMPPRKVYEITNKGRGLLRDMLCAESLRMAFVPSPFDAVVGMLAYTRVLSRAESIAILTARKQALRERLEKAHPHHLGDLVESLYGYLARSLYDKARLLLIAELEWIDCVLQRAETSEWETLQVPPDFLDKEKGFQS